MTTRPNDKRDAERAVGMEIDIRLIRNDRAADEDGVARFTAAMLDKLATKRAEGRGGWNRELANDGCSVADLVSMLSGHLKKGDMVDIANFCMMIWNRENVNGQARLAAAGKRVKR